MNYKLLGRSGLKVSELCLGTMGFGTENGWGADQNESFAILESFGNAGGNFLDTANIYKNGTSEKIIGEFLTVRDRDYWVVATKYSLKDNETNVNASGNSRKNMMRSVEESLKRMKTDFIDVFYLHIYDWITPVEEIMQGLNDLVRSGKVNYIAVSDTPAWVISKMQTMADLMGWNKFIALQIEYSLLQRTVERELIPMAKHFGLTVTPWAPLAGGALTGKYLVGDRGRIKEGSSRLNETAQNITREVVRISEETGSKPSQVAMQWLRQQDVSCIPIVGATKLSQMKENIDVVNVQLNADQMQRLNQISAIEPGFPLSFYREEGVKQNNYGGFFDRVEKPDYPA